MGIDIEYLLTFLADELQGLDDVRILATLPSTTRKAADMPQDYDPNEHSVHLNRGVTVRAGSRDYFFPAEWATSGKQDLITTLAREIRDFLES